MRVEFGEGHLDRVQVGAIGGQEQEPGADPLQTLGCPGALVDGEVVENDDVAALERGRELGFDINVELSIGIETGPPIGSQKGPLPLVASGQRA